MLPYALLHLSVLYNAFLCFTRPLCFITLCCAFTVGHFSKGTGCSCCIEGSLWVLLFEGPNVWISKPYGSCNGTRQSPIDIDTETARTDQNLSQFTFSDYEDENIMMEIINTRKTVTSASLNLSLSLDDLISGVNRSKFYRYSGSLTTPPCQESVLWTIFEEKIHVSKDLKPFVCQCGRRFSESGSLKIHQRVHSGAKPYDCEECGASFRYLKSLKTHRRVHTGERPHVCADCDKSFSDVGCLRKHRRIHTGVKPYRCAACGETFRYLKGLKSHEKSHAKEPL
ncbi:UNVERIFIED_CONTAM: hypothetical protein FKN15_046350 [Acipenser sinensis]